MAAFRGSYPPVTPLEKGVGSVNLPETSAAATSFKLRGDAASPAATTGTARSRRQAPACRDGHCCCTLVCRSGGMVGGSPRRLRPIPRWLRDRHDPQQHRRRAAASVRNPGADHVPQRLPPPRPAVAADPAVVSRGSPAFTPFANPVCGAIARQVVSSGGRSAGDATRRMRCQR